MIVDVRDTVRFGRRRRASSRKRRSTAHAWWFRFVFVLQDFKGGNIRGALNIPSEHFYNDAQVDDLVERFAQSQYVVFHCMFSQQRVSEDATWAKEGPVV